MTQPPQYPGPSEPEGGPPPIPPSEPSQAAPPPAQNPYGQNPYGQAPPPTPQAPYGQAPYGQAPYGQAPYGAPFPGGPRQESAPQGMAITSLVLAFLGCLILPAIASIVLAVIVLRRGRDGRNHGKGLAIGALVVSGLSLLAGLALAAVIAIGVAVSEDVNDLEAGDCFNAPTLSDDSEEFTTIDTVSCNERHDGEVLGTVTLDLEKVQAHQVDPDAGNTWCAEATNFWTPPADSDLGLIRLTNSADPEIGDTLACVVYNRNGDKLTEPVR